MAARWGLLEATEHVAVSSMRAPPEWAWPEPGEHKRACPLQVHHLYAPRGAGVTRWERKKQAPGSVAPDNSPQECSKLKRGADYE